MGAVTNAADDAAQLAQVHAMHKDARRWIQHHLGNALAGAMGMLQIGRYEEAMAALDHAAADLRQITPPDERAAISKINKHIMKERWGR